MYVHIYYIYFKLNHVAIHLKLKQHCKLIIFQLKKKDLSIQVHGFHAAAAAAKSLQSCPTLCDPIDGSPPGCPIPGIPQARTLEWVAISFSSA